MKIVDPLTGAEVPQGAEGILLVRGPNVMKGYLGDSGNGLINGWFRTGDRASIDSEGFLRVAAQSGKTKAELGRSA